ncbi:MAG: class I SAM-dependent methyltransferase [Bacteroidota bacterium]
MKTPLRWKVAQAVELKWWQRYLRYKPTDEYIQWKKDYWITFLEKIDVKVSPNEVVLDAGCGPAGLFSILNKNKVVALDPLLDAYESKLPHFSKSTYPWVTFYNKAIEDFESPFVFDTIFCLNAINHVADLGLCLENLSSLLVPGGRLIISVDAHNNEFLKRIFQLIPGDILHPHQYNLSEYCSMIERTGLKIQHKDLVKKELIFSYFVCIAHRL